MTLLDRYILRYFFLNFAILLVVFALLFVVINVIVDLDEFLEAGQKLAQAGRFGSAWLGTLWAVVDYNGPIVVLLYVFFSGLLVVAAMGFTFAALHRTGELTAMLAGGISMFRTLAPVLVAGAALSGLALPIQEFVVPRLAEKLTRPKSEIIARRFKAQDLSYVRDDAGSLLTASDFNPTEKRLRDVTILERDEHGLTNRRVTAESADWDERSQAWLLRDAARLRPGPATAGDTSPVSEAGFRTSLTPEMLHRLKASGLPIRDLADDAGNTLTADDYDPAQTTLRGVRVEERRRPGHTAIEVTADWATWDPRSHSWALEGGSSRIAFYTTLTPEVLLARQKSAYPRFLSLQQLEKLSRNPVVDTDEMRQIMHSRFSLLVMNVLVLVMGFRFFLLREPANMLLQGVKAAGVCIGVWGTALVILETGGDLLNPVAASWLPVCLCLPLSFALLRGVRT